MFLNLQDGGGLFKDFMEELMRAGLSAEYGLFASNAAHQLYPNPAALRLVEDAPRLLAFLGRMLGKAVYENVLLELPLAGERRAKTPWATGPQTCYSQLALPLLHLVPGCHRIHFAYIPH